MENYDFYTSWGHGKMKDFVVDYAAKIATQKVAAPAASTTAVKETAPTQ